MVLTKSLTALCDLFLNGACNEIKVLIPYPIEEVDDELCKLGWKETTDSHGNAVFLPSDRDDDLDFPPGSRSPASARTRPPSGSATCEKTSGALQ